MVIYVERFHSDLTSATRFISRGLKRLGRRGGRDGRNILAPGTVVCGHAQGKTIVLRDLQGHGAADDRGPVRLRQGLRRGRRALREAGEGGPAAQSGRPWTCRRTRAASRRARPEGPDTVGGLRAGRKHRRQVWAGPPSNPAAASRSAHAPSPAAGPSPRRCGQPPGCLRPGPSRHGPGAWLHPLSVQSYLLYLRDLYLAGDPLVVRKGLDDYSRCIQLLKGGPAGRRGENAFSTSSRARSSRWWGGSTAIWTTSGTRSPGSPCSRSRPT